MGARRNLKMMTPNAVFVQNTLNLSLWHSTLAFATYKLHLKHHKIAKLSLSHHKIVKFVQYSHSPSLHFLSGKIYSRGSRRTHFDRAEFSFFDASE